MQGKTINGYTLLRPLGKGGMAEVWYAENRIGKKAAVKLLLPQFCADETVKSRFYTEAKVMVDLDHPNIREVYDFGELDDRPAIIMEYLEGEDLKTKIKQNQHFTDDELKRWWNQMADALNYTHALGIIHRDIKPGNIFIDKKGNVKLLDFGIAKVRESISATQTGQLLGTLMYMSPEQVDDPKRVDYRTDIYSLAVSFVYLLTGRPPYDTNSSSDYKIQVSIVTKPLDLTGVPAEWQTFLKPYLEKDPSKRPALRAFDSKVTENPVVNVAVADVTETDEGTVVAKAGKPETQTSSIKQEDKLATGTVNKPKNKKGLWIGLVVGMTAVIAVVLFVLLKLDNDTNAFKACQTVDDYRNYIRDYGCSAEHFEEAKVIVVKHEADSTVEAQMKEQTTITAIDSYLETNPHGMYETELRTMKTELINMQYYKYLMDYLLLNIDNDDYLVAPSVMGVNDPILNKLVADLVNLNQEKEQKQLTITDQHPVIMKLNEQIYIIKQSILVSISDLISKTQTDIINLKESIKTLDNDERKKILDTVKKLEEERSGMIANMQYYKRLQTYMEENIDNPDNLAAPSAMGINDPLLNKLVADLINLNQQKALQLLVVTEEHPIIVKLDEQIFTTKRTILENINNLVENAQLSINDIENRIKEKKKQLPEIEEAENEQLEYIKNTLNLSSN